jgi:hypothetical protein
LEVDEEFRHVGDRGHGPSGKMLYFGRPICAINAYRINLEADNDSLKETLKVLLSERQCEGFTPWQKGYTPKEHLEMNLLEQQRQRGIREREDDRRWREQQAERDRVWRQQDAASLNDQLRRDRFWNVLYAAIGVSGTLAAVYLAKLIGQP